MAPILAVRPARMRPTVVEANPGSHGYAVSILIGGSPTMRTSLDQRWLRRCRAAAECRRNAKSVISATVHCSDKGDPPAVPSVRCPKPGREAAPAATYHDSTYVQVEMMQ